jgi:catechol 2,3-dioxygenase-like lactoylglutathione lyase family enzyme
MAPSIHHVTLSVTDVEKSAAWYQALLGPAEATYPDSGDGFERVALLWSGGPTLVLRHDHALAPGDRFSPLRVGLDHLSFRCGSQDEVAAYAARMDDLGVARGPLEEADYAWAVTGRDPDGIAIEFYCDRG